MFPSVQRNTGSNAYGGQTLTAGSTAARAAASYAAGMPYEMGAAGEAADTAGASAANGTARTNATACETCKSRKYQDISTDAGVSFKAPANIDPSIAASAVMGHEQEHVALAQGRAAEQGGRIIASVTLETAICEECGRVYVSGGKAHITTITPSRREDGDKRVGAMEGAAERKIGGEAGDKAIGKTGGDMPGNAVTNMTPKDKVTGKVTLEDGGADLFRKIYKQTMTANFGLFLDTKA